MIQEAKEIRNRTNQKTRLLENANKGLGRLIDNASVFENLTQRDSKAVQDEGGGTSKGDSPTRRNCRKSMFNKRSSSTAPMDRVKNVKETVTAHIHH